MSTLFTKILNGEIPGRIFQQDDLCAVIYDIQPQAPHHFLIFPKKEIRSLAEADTHDQKTLGHMLLVAGQVARDQGFSESGYRVVINTGKNGGQSVDHIHFHLLAGRPLTWPPG